MIKQLGISLGFSLLVFTHQVYSMTAKPIRLGMISFKFTKDFYIGDKDCVYYVSSFQTLKQVSPSTSLSGMVCAKKLVYEGAAFDQMLANNSLNRNMLIEVARVGQSGKKDIENFVFDWGVNSGSGNISMEITYLNGIAQSATMNFRVEYPNLESFVPIDRMNELNKLIDAGLIYINKPIYLK